jgi:hypothetical protein
MPGAAEAEMLSKNAWAAVFLVATVALSILVLAGLLYLTIRAYQCGDTAIGVLLTVLWVVVGGGWMAGVLVGLVCGWTLSARWQVRTFMKWWTALIVLAGATFALSAVIKKMSLDVWRAWFGWLPAL